MFKILTNRILMQLALFILVSYAALSKPISSEEAKEIAMQHNLQMNKYSIELQDPSAYKLIASSHDIFSKATKNPTFYIYNFPQKGWVIVAGDDIARPVLAYSKDASYGLENLHDNAKYWLEVYDLAISEAIKQGTPQSEKIANEWLMARNPKKRTSLLDEVIPPLIKTKWGQESPYNNLCPYDEDEKKRTLTGCVATTMAQIMKYWDFPVNGIGEKTYGHGQYGKLHANFENTTYDWENMTNEYNQNSTKEEIKAVATLMYHCGVALSMHYGVETSGTEEHYIVSSLKTYFMYDNSIKLIHRSDYDDNTWTNILKKNLDNNQPMPYAGEANAIRHSFICDGYDTDGRFHFNLGWNGNSNGYYYIDGITNLELNLKQNAIINIKPVEEFRPQISLLKPLELKQEIVYQNSTLKINANIINNKSESFSGSISLRLFDAGDNFVMTVAEQEIDNLEPNKPIEITFETDPLFNLYAGKYYVKLYHKHDILNSWLLSSGHNKLVLDVKKTNTGSKLSLYSLPTLSTYQVYKGDSIKAIASFINTSEEDFTGIISALIYDEKGTMIKELASYNVTKAIVPNHHIKNIEFSNIISGLDCGFYFIGFRSKDEGGEFVLVNTNGFISFIKFEIVVIPPNLELIKDLRLKNWIKSNTDKLPEVVVTEDGGIIGTKTNLEALAKIETLECSNSSSLVTIDELIRHMLSLKKLECNNNSLIELDVSKNIKLEELYCYNNQLTNLDIGSLPILTKLNCCNQAKGFMLYLNNEQKNKFTEKNYCDAILYTELITDLQLKKWIKYNAKKLPEVVINKDGGIYNTTTNLEALAKIDSLDCTYSLSTINELIIHMLNLKTLICNKSSLIELDLSKNIKLEELYCNNNQLTNLNISKNIKLIKLDCSHNQLNNLDVSKNIELTYLNCYENKLTNLDISNNIKLETLYCYNNQLTNLNISKNIELTYLICSYNKLINLDMNKNKHTKLKKLICHKNQINDLDVSKSIELTYLSCSYNKLINLDVSKNMKLKELYCNNNQINNLDVTNNINLIRLDCSENQLNKLEVSKSIELTFLKCNHNQLINLDINKNIKLKELHCYKNQLNKLEVTSNINLIQLGCFENKLTNLDVNKNIKLETLHCYKNQLNNLDLSSNIKLKKLYCDHNQITSLDVSNNIELTYLRCNHNQLTKLDIIKNIRLLDLYCNDNILNNLDISPLPILTKLNCCNQAKGFILYLTNKQKNRFNEKDYCNAILHYIELPELITDPRLKKWISDNKNKLPKVIVNDDGGIDSTTTNLEALAKVEILDCTNSKLITIDELIIHMPNLKTLICSNTSLIELDVSENINLITLACYNNQISKLYLNKNIKLKELHCYNNKLINLDLSKNLELTSLKCNNNLLADLDVSNNVNLETLHCSDNQLNNLDISNSIELTSLKCNHNQLTNLDVSKNIKLKELHCFNNQLRNLDVSKSINLIQLCCFDNQLTNLDLSKNIKLEALYCYKNQLTNLDMSSNIKLKELYCENNQITSLDISPLTSLTKLNCCNQAEGFILYLTNAQKSKFTEANYCNAILKEKNGSICEVEWLDIYPNPTVGKFFIVNKFFTDEIKIFNVAGEVLYRTILNDEKTEIDISNLPAGVYLVITKGKIGKVVKN
ncbi:MAG: C10 family peptidase [Candidatus Kapaibacterium sp.]|jgi:Leucine-rich repeat (LRR) protein